MTVCAVGVILQAITISQDMPSQKKYSRPVLKRYQPDDTYKALPLPAPSGRYPYHLDAGKFTELHSGKFSFHMVGDTGGMRYPEGQHKVAEQLLRQIEHSSAGESPAFLYHLGDIVYHYGEAEHYDRQFFKPYAQYPGPVFAIAGNHDSDVNPANPVPYNSLDAFTTVFCDTRSRDIAFNKSSSRKSMVQPHVYFTLQTPLANIIGLHSNVPKFGYIDDDQRNWFVEELKATAKERPGKAIIVCVHHAPYTADVNHGSSLYMINFLEAAFAESGVRPDIIFSGHVHNYQRFEKTYTDAKVLPFIVCGAGGFDELHDLVSVGDPMFNDVHPLLENVQMQNYCVMKHGFLNITLERKAGGVSISGDYYALGADAKDNVHADRFEYFCG